jgi:beta-xylosidase
VAERENTTFCAASTFLLTPGLPVYASKDLTNWKLASHALSRESQFGEFNLSLAQSDGIWAPTIRYHDGTFYIITIYKDNVRQKSTGLIFNTTDPFSNDAWSDPIRYVAETIDPDLFWDDDGNAFVATSGTDLQTVDVRTGALGERHRIWNGTTGIYLEGPHIYRRDGYYYLLAAEGGSGLNHTVTMARSKNIWGPYHAYGKNPVMTNAHTSEYFQNIGHADLFHDQNGNWWSSALAWRSGSEGKTYPMGREMVLTPVTWKEGDWPSFAPVRGVYEGWYLAPSKDIPGDGPFANEPDVVDFEPSSTIPRHFGFWRWSTQDKYTVSPPGHPGTLRLKPSKGSITAGYRNLTAGYNIEDFTLIMRRQTDTLFQYSVDVSFSPQVQNEEVGVTVFLNQVQNINLGIVMLPRKNATSQHLSLAPHFRFLVSALGSDVKQDFSQPIINPVPHSWLDEPVRLIVRAENPDNYTFYASPSSRPWILQRLGEAPAAIVSGGVGPFTGTFWFPVSLILVCNAILTLPHSGTLVGVYATSNGGKGSTESYISRWRYEGLAQEVDNGVLVPS